MYFAERLTNLKDYGIDNASDVLEYMDNVKNTFATGHSFKDINHALGLLNAGRSKLRTKIIEKANPAQSGPKNLTVVTLDTRAAKGQQLLTTMALDLVGDPLSVQRTTQLAYTRANHGDKIIIAVTQGNMIKPVPVKIPANPENYSAFQRGSPESVGGRLRTKINQSLLAGRSVQLLKDELRMFRRIGFERRLALSDLGLKLDEQGRLKLRAGDGMSDVMDIYFKLIGTQEHVPMLRAIAHFARVEPVFITAESQRTDFQEWHRILSEYQYHKDPRVLRALSSAGITAERTALNIKLPGEPQAKPVTGFYFHVPWSPDCEDINRMPELDEIPQTLLLALAQRSNQLPNNPEICKYLILNGALKYLQENVLGPRGASLEAFKPHLYVYNQFGRPYLIRSVQLRYAAIDYSSFPYMKHCFQPTKVAALLLKKVREAQHRDSTEQQTSDEDLLRILTDVGLELSNGKIDIAHLFPKIDERRKIHLERNVQMAADKCHFRTKESEFLNVARTVLASVLASRANQS